MSLLDPIVNLVTFFKFLKPKTFQYGKFPQSIKSPSVELKEMQYGLFEGSDGATYAPQTVHCKKSVVFSDGQRFADGETAYFKIEPVVWEIGGPVYTKGTKYKGSVEVIKFEKKDSVYCTSKYVLALSGRALESFCFDSDDEKILPDVKPCPVDSYPYFTDAYALKPVMGLSKKRHARKKATDYAIACGVTVKGGKAYHTLMSNSACVAPNGKYAKLPAKSAAGEVLRCTVKKVNLSKLKTTSDKN